MWMFRRKYRIHCTVSFGTLSFHKYSAVSFDQLERFCQFSTHLSKQWTLRSATISCTFQLIWLGIFFINIIKHVLRYGDFNM